MAGGQQAAQQQTKPNQTENRFINMKRGRRQTADGRDAHDKREAVKEQKVTEGKTECVVESQQKSKLNGSVFIFFFSSDFVFISLLAIFSHFGHNFRQEKLCSLKLFVGFAICTYIDM